MFYAMNKGGFSLARLLGITAVKSRLSRKLKVPLTKSGRDAKLGRMIQSLLGSLLETDDGEKKEKNDKG
jgi:hypothetical protein